MPLCDHKNVRVRIAGLRIAADAVAARSFVHSFVRSSARSFNIAFDPNMKYTSCLLLGSQTSTIDTLLARTPFEAK